MPRCVLRPIAIATLVLIGACQQSGINEISPEDRAKVARINTELAFKYLQEREYETALGKLDKALEADSNYADAYNAQGLLHAALGQYEDAEKSFKRALRLNPNNSSALNNYGQFLCQRKRYEEGEKRFLEAVANPLYNLPAVAYSNAGTCAFEAGDLSGAEDHFRAALEIDPRLGPALLQMADISFQLERFLPARAYLQRYAEVARHTARSLWLGVRVERELGDRDAEASYSLQLRKNFPDSRETKLLFESSAQ